jgi:Domain of unknown function DUF83
MFTEDDLLPLSGLQHMAFCERQWALIHIEQQWEENPLTAEGRVLHDHVHEAGSQLHGWSAERVAASLQAAMPNPGLCRIDVKDP